MQCSGFDSLSRKLWVLRVRLCELLMGGLDSSDKKTVSIEFLCKLTE